MGYTIQCFSFILQRFDSADEHEQKSTRTSPDILSGNYYLETQENK